MTRHECREIALKIVFSQLGSQDSFNYAESAKVIDEVVGVSDDDNTFIQTIVEAAISNTDEIVKTVESNLKGYDIKRLYKVDKAILFLAIAEMNILKLTPQKIVINEAVELAKTFSTDDSPKFINGVLASIVKA